MTEEKIYHVGDTGLAEGVSLGRITVVLGADFDRVKAERDALQLLLNERDEQLDAQRLRADTAEAELNALKDEVGQAKGEYDRAVNKLAAAEQRIAKLNGLLREGIDSFEELLTSRDTREVLVDLGAWGDKRQRRPQPQPRGRKS